MDLIEGLLCEPQKRLGSKRGASELKQHAFFEGFVWEGIREREAPWKPTLTDGEDTRYFQEDLSHRQVEEEHDNDDDTNGNEFYGFTFKRHFIDGGLSPALCQGNKSNNTGGGSNLNESNNRPPTNNPDPVYV